MNAVYDDVVKLVDKELESANKMFPMFRSAHEGYAVLMEEFDELGEDVDEIGKLMNELWFCVRHDTDASNKPHKLYGRAVLTAVEAIQVAAMAKKFQESMEKFNG